MTHDDLMKMFGLKDKPKSTAVDVDAVEEIGSGSQKYGGSHETVLQLTDWDMEQGAKLANTPNCKATAEAMADFFGMSFMQNPTACEEGCTDAKREQFVNTMLETPDYRSLHTSTMSNYMASEMAAVEISRAFAELCEEQNEDGNKSPNAGDGEPQDGMDESSVLNAVAKAVTQSQEKVDELNDITSAMGLGGDGGSDGRMDVNHIASIFSKVRNSRMLKRICELAGRYRRAAQAKQRTKTSHGYDDMIGVVLDGEVSRLLPLELAMLTDEDLELDAMRRLVERQSMCREFRGVEKQAKGPIVVCVDESGSMAGDPVANAKALALAMAWIARHQNRWCALIGYSGGTAGTRLVLPPGKWDEVKLTEWLEHFYSGGTTMDVPLAELPTTYWNEMNAPKGKTDVIIITDAQVDVPVRMRDQFLAWKKQEKVNCIGIVLGSSAGDLSQVCDQVHCIRSLSVDNAAVEACMSI